MTDDAGFLAEIAANPDDAAPYLVYSDALMLRGDPRGDLISIQHALETAPPFTAADLRRREAALLEANAEAWLGPVLEHRDAIELRWRFGFVHAARATTPDAVHALFAMPASESTFTELRLGSAVNLADDDPWPAVQPLVDAVTWHPALRRLHVGDLELRGMFLAPPVRLPEQAKHLDTLVVQSPRIRLAWDRSPAQLRRLELRTPDAAALAATEWPNLESLVVWTADPAPILAWLARGSFPRLRHLGLCGTANTAQIVTELARHPVTAQLTSLDLRGGVLTGAAAIAKLAPRIALDVRFNGLATKAREKLVALGATVHPQRSKPAPLCDRDSLFALCQRVSRSHWSFDEGNNRVAAYRRYVASSPDPFWVFDGRCSIADDTRGADKRLMLSELVRDSIDQLVAVPIRDRTQLCYALGLVCDELVEGHEAECWLWQSVTEARWQDERRAEIRALGLIGTTRMRRGDPVHALAAMDRVLEHYLEHGSKQEQAWALRQRGNVDLVRSEFAAAEPFYRRALEIYRELKDTSSEAIVLSELAGVLWSRQDFDGAVAILKQSIEGRGTDSLGLASAYYNLGAVLNGMSRLDDARAAAEQSLAIFRKHDRRDGVGQALSLLGELAQRSDRHDEAEKLLDEALACHRDRGAIRETGITLGNLSRVALDRAQYAKARAYCEEAVELHRECGNKYNEGMQLLGLVDAAIGERRWDDALAHVDEALVPLTAIANYPAISAIKLRRGFVAQLRGRFAEVDAHYDEAIADTRRGNYPELVGWAQLYRAVLRMQQGRPAEVEPLFAEAEGYLQRSVQGMLSLAVAKTVVRKLAGEDVTLPTPSGFDARVLLAFTSSASDRT